MSVNILALSAEQIAQLSVAEILSCLVRVPSVNPLWQSTTASLAHEKAMAEFLAELFQKLVPLGAKVDIEYVTPTRPNTMVRIPGNTKSWIVWDTHTDTVGTSNMTIVPFGGTIRDGKVWGRGACDTKASAAVAIKLVFEALTKGIRPDKNLLLVFSMGEENGGEGAKEVNPWIKSQGIVVEQWITSEPTMLQCVFAHNGLVRGQLILMRQHGSTPQQSYGSSACFEITGRSGHTSDPDKAVNALYAAAKLALLIQAATGFDVTGFQCGGMGNTIPNSCIMQVACTGNSPIGFNLAESVSQLASSNLIAVQCLQTQQVEQTEPEVIYAAVKAILALEIEHQRLKSEGQQSVTGRPVVSATGLSTNANNTCTISFDRRVVPGESPDLVLEKLIEMLDSAMQNSDMTLAIGTNPAMRKLSGFATDRSSALITGLESLSGNPSTTAQYGTNLLFIDPTVFVGGKVVAVVFGPGDIAQAHTADEFITIEQLELAYRLMAKFLGLSS